MRNLIAFLVKYNHWFVFVFLETMSMIMLFRYNAYQGSVWLSSANIVAGKVYEYDSRLKAFFRLTRINEELSKNNVLLESEVERLRRQAIKDDGANGATDTSLLDGFKLIPAKVIGSSVSNGDNLITINRGAADGVTADMGVVSGNGVVGVVYMTSRHYAVVIPLLNKRSSLSCRIRGRGYFGMLRWTGGDPTVAFMEDVPRHARFRSRERVVTSGFSSIFPEGLPVGNILHVYNSPDGLSFRLAVALATDFGSLRDVFVVDNTPMEERITLLRSAKDSLKIKE